MPPKQKTNIQEPSKEEQSVVSILSEKEMLLGEELKNVNLELEDSKNKISKLRMENEWLQQEALRVRIESHEYMSYMEKKTSKRQTSIITLSDQNREEIRIIQQERRLMEQEFNDKKQALEAVLLEKQQLLEKANQELNDLQEYKDVQTEQLSKIHDLERQIVEARGHHTNTIQRLKVDFSRQKEEFQSDAKKIIQTLEKKANKDATQCLRDHTNRIKQDNGELRQELLTLIKDTKVLTERQNELVEQHKHLLQEQSYVSDMKKLKGLHQQKAFKCISFTEDTHE